VSAKNAIRTPFSLIHSRKILSQMNPLANAMLAGFRSVEIQAIALGTRGKGGTEMSQ
jgi:hypothetical protein